MKKIILLLSTLIITSCATSNTKKTEPAPKSTEGFDALLTGYNYPYPVSFYEFEAQGQKLKMAYMDVLPEGTPKKTVVFFHGKNFSGFYFEPIMKELVSKGYRAIAIDQVGFGKSSKPENFQYSFQTMAKFSADLLTSIGVKDFILTGHSMGGMLSTRFALMYPERVSKLILVNPIGLEDYKTMVPFKSVDEQLVGELKNNETKIRDYQKQAYYDGVWKPEYEPMIIPAVGWTKGPDSALIAKNSVLLGEIIYTQPVFYEFKNLKVPTTMINGDRDKTAPGKALATPANQKLMGNYPKLGRDVTRVIPKGKLVTMKGLGHVPFVEDFQGFMKLYLAEL